jgi:hypothetical protein
MSNGISSKCSLDVTLMPWDCSVVLVFPQFIVWVLQQANLVELAWSPETS